MKADGLLFDHESDDVVHSRTTILPHVELEISKVLEGRLLLDFRLRKSGTFQAKRVANRYLRCQTNCLTDTCNVLAWLPPI